MIKLLAAIGAGLLRWLLAGVVTIGAIVLVSAALGAAAIVLMALLGLFGLAVLFAIVSSALQARANG